MNRSSELALEKYDTDKMQSRYFGYYDPILEPYVNQKITLLEMGVFRGGSLRLWQDYFPLGNIVGVDLKLPEGFNPGGRIRLYQGSQSDIGFLSRVAHEAAPEGFDIIIDDASHIGTLTKEGFWHLFEHHLKPGGLYVIEDWGTGYWDDWPDGKRLDFELYARNSLRQKVEHRLGRKSTWPNHSHGMVAFVKQLVDEQGAQDATKHGKPRASRFESLTIFPGLVFVKKAMGH